MTASKRALDLLGASLGLLLFAPAFGLVALAITLDDGGPVFFRQLRIGAGGIPFRIWKFRTMRPTAGTPITVGADRRITRVGRWLRRYRLDELPQLLNVLTGTMSLVGPRPEVPEFVAAYSPVERELLRYRPGMTDPASLQFRNEADILGRMADPVNGYRVQVLPLKLAASLSYARRATTWSDLRVLMATALAVVADGTGHAAAMPRNVLHDSSEVRPDAPVR
ncbi:MAG TPA: sugar transferase [Gemmatimonadales bacterium]|nr:sugar transferase [Gemmatimonadales bacterium]